MADTGGYGGDKAADLAAAAEESEEEDDDVEEIDDDEFLKRQAAISQGRGAHRASISAESWSNTGTFKPPVHEKTPAQREAIKAACMRSFMFKALSDDQLKIVLDAFKGPMEVEADKKVIQQGDIVGAGEPGLYIIEKGTLDVFKVTGDAAAPGKKVFTYDQTGQTFGELALLYSSPRAATVIATTSSVLWSIDRETFNNCVKGAIQALHERREKFLASVDILKDLTAAERQKIADVLNSRTCTTGDKIIKQGDKGSEFFILEEGNTHAEVEGTGTVKNYGPGDYFGELALLKDQARKATVVADSEATKLAVLDEDSFKRLLGPLRDLMTKRAVDYGPSGQ